VAPVELAVTLEGDAVTKATFDARERAKRARDAKREDRMNLVFTYCEILERPSDGLFHDINKLPAPKVEMVKAFLFAIANAEMPHEADLYTAAMFTLANYQKDVGEKSLSIPGDGVDTPADLERLLRDYPFARLQHYNAVHSQEMDLLKKAALAALKVNFFLVPWYRKFWHRLTGKGQFDTRYGGVIDFPD
jgi:hypothetical protein